jgi:hypothetical protein
MKDFKLVNGGGLQNIQEKERWQLFSNSTSYERRAGLNKLTCSSNRGGSL